MDAHVPLHELYRTHALDCLHEARVANDRELSDVFHRLAVWWVALAHEVEEEHSSPFISSATGTNE
jgi:hypothetical protein